MAIKALTFDVFGTVVDWRSSIIEQAGAFGRERGIDADWAAFADGWRGKYQPAMERVRSGATGWQKLDHLHRQNLLELLDEFGIRDLDHGDVDHLNRIWHRLRPWPDAVAGLTRMKRDYILATLSNGNVSLIVNMAKHAGLPWDMVLGAEVVGHYKPQPEAYLKSAGFLDLAPAECLMVAAHNGDLVAAGGCGLRTAFVRRPTEHGPTQDFDCEPENDYDFVADDFLDLAEQLGC
ncbi:MAG: haloacid dehalogenase type II [Alphaproteobacteria bacterium]|jgi:2-haloacid dehalogenase|nr:haloacid dehalogenase type II [Alphaproteobacteria bacterium]MDP6565143.1 haloacid dehalogenase type II [Alphaproteobacteria bacterium]